MDLYQNSSDQSKLAPKDKLQKTKMDKGKMILKYLIKFTQCRDELGSVGIMVSKDDMVSLYLLDSQRVGIIIRTLLVVGRNYQIGNNCGRI